MYLFNQTFVYTTLFSALFMILSLKFMQLFSFIKWSPIGWEKKFPLFSTFHFTVKWGILFVALLIIFAVIYMIVSHLTSIPPALTAIFISVLGIIALEWFISEPKSPMEVMTSISIPLLSVTAIVLRFIVGTAVFYKEISRKV